MCCDLGESSPRHGASDDYLVPLSYSQWRETTFEESETQTVRGALHFILENSSGQSKRGRPPRHIGASVRSCALDHDPDLRRVPGVHPAWFLELSINKAAVRLYLRRVPGMLMRIWPVPFPLILLRTTCFAFACLPTCLLNTSAARRTRTRCSSLSWALFYATFSSLCAPL
ncbi:hypothetical protein EXIGLDRAFT_340939 [Exidia glandulosa HHB12029]|uniref:Uncharacterized protein n=1 Tax=Exidia glandulosa HHB12029 TaxID=1314781 RepID=A0A165CIG6_EXIGL|nr:hypothetical protein EXIGLDRAFT_340939 [Exidia glandulosa HHB12029]